ncbi:murein biosynthesis integral membrane protein MurJ [Lysobacter sp. KIS68-7]|uniref:murein biosynthesis integral membrane protein MurJ n=1 Tax=Lysobacter sp. KIS68-7 TaxID=2904252 RepID=UPI001E4A4A26|nr:murein biosynthesis integral membrane protein MurJ [Lysobacter sp. KIS68-7]UHQ21123.1 murein biosynthesis integral membrane protein MurJ [Lysobacter sp. KIS68-7]
MLRGLLSFGSMTMVSRVFGLVRDMVINSVFGANAGTDAFWVAFRIPNFMRRLFAEGSFSTAFVPVFTEIKEKRSHEDLKELVSRTAGTLGGVLAIIVALGVLFAPQVTLLFSPGSAANPEKFALTVELLRLTFPFLLFVSLTALAGGALNSFHRFGMPALTPVILNLCMIGGAIWLSPKLDVPILALGWSILAAGVLQLLFQLPQLAKLDLLSLPKWGASHPDVRKVMRLMVPTLFGSSIAQINLLLDTVIASLLIAGSQTWLSQADRFLELPLGVFGVALGTVILPALARHHVNTDRAGFSNALDWGLRTTLMISIPAALGLMLLSVPLVSTLFQHGRFTAFDTRMAALSVFGLSFGLPAFALVKVVLPAFYARQDTKTPVRAGVASLVANMVFNGLILAILYVVMVPEHFKQGPILVALSSVPGLHFALGLASAAASYLNLMLLWRWLRQAGVYERKPGWGVFLLRLGVACAAMVVFLIVALRLGPDFTAVRVATRILWLGLLVGGGAAVYGAAMLAMGFRPSDLREH